MESSQKKQQQQQQQTADPSDSDEESFHEIDPQDLMTEKVFHFYCHVNKTDPGTNFHLRLKNLDSTTKQIQMQRLDDNIFYAHAKINEDNLGDRNEIRYSYIKYGTQDTLDQSEESEQEKTKGKKYFRLNTFFDTFGPKKFAMMMPPIKTAEGTEPFIKFLILHATKADKHFGQPRIFAEYLDYLKEDGITFPYSNFFNLVKAEYATRCSDPQFNLYIIELFSYFDLRVLKKKIKYVIPLANEMQIQSKNQFGFFRNLIRMDESSQITPQVYEKLIHGIQNLITVNPLIGLEFFNDKDIIMSKGEFTKTLNLKDDYNFHFVKQAIKTCYQDFNYTKHDLKPLIEQALIESKSLEIFLSATEEFMNFAQHDCLEKCTLHIKSRFNVKDLQTFIKVNLERIINIAPLQKILRSEIQIQILSNLRHNLHTSNFQHLLSNPELVDIYYLQQIVEIKSNSYLQNEYKRLVIAYLKHSHRPAEFNDIHNLLIKNFVCLVFSQQTFVKCYNFLCDFVDLTDDPVFTQKVVGFSQAKLLDSLKKNMAASMFSYTITFLIEDILQVLSNNTDLRKTGLLIEVALEIINKIEMNESSIELILEKIFQNDRLIYSQLKPLSDYVFQKMAKIKNLTLPYLFDDQLVYQALRISLNYENNDFLKKLLDRVSTFLQKINDRSILLKDVSLIIVNKKKFLEPMLKVLNPAFSPTIFDDLVEINRAFKEKIEKHQCYLHWASKSSIAVDLKSYESDFMKIQTSFDTLSAANALTKDNWLFAQAFHTIDHYYHFRNSKLFENLFLTMSQETGRIQLFDDDQKELQYSVQARRATVITSPQQPQESMVKQITMQQFDTLSYNILFGRICQEHFECLMQYPQISLKQDILQRYWQNINPKYVQTELSQVLEYEQKIINNKEAQISMDLIDHLQKYGNQFIYFYQALTLQSLEAFGRQQKVFDLDQDVSFLKLRKYVEFVSSIDHEIDLEIIAREVSKIEDIFQYLEKNEHVKQDILEELSRSKDTFEFSIANIGLDFNDLFERLDEDSFLTNATISDMNSVSNYFNNFYSKLQNLQGVNDFLALLEFFSNDLQQQINQDKNFKQKLSNCSANLSAIKQIADATKNVAENTLKIIKDSLDYGHIIWNKSKEKFYYELKIIYGQRVLFASDEEEKSQANLATGGSKQQQMQLQQHNQQPEQQQQQYRIVNYDQDKVNQHCSRAILLIHSKKTNPNQQQQIEEDVNLFAQIVGYSQEINSLLKELSQYGKLKYKDESRQEVQKIKRGSIQKDLMNMQQHLINELNEWKKLLTNLRKKYYFLTYVPNSLIADLIEIFDKPSSESLMNAVRKFKEYRMLPQNIAENALEMAIEGDNYYEKFQNIWTHYLQEFEAGLRTRIERITTQFQLQASKVQYRYVTDDLTLIKAILSLFTISGTLPQSTDILFCTEQTQINEIETFVMRSMLCNLKVPGRKRLFVIANFQKLEFSTQNQVYDLIKSQERTYSAARSYFYLYIMSVCQDIRQAHLIEELRSGSTLFQQNIRDDQLKEVFKRFDHIRVVKSDQCGLGKSEFIRSQIIRSDKIIARIPIYGELNRQKLIKLHSDRILKDDQGNPRTKEDQAKLAIHYDIYPTTKEELNVIMFELLILGSLNDYQNNTFYLPRITPSPAQQGENGLKIYIEINQSLNEDFIYFFFNYLKNYDIRWDFTGIKVGNTKDDKVQKVCRYLHALEDEKKYKPELLIDNPQIFTEFECHQIIKKHLLQKLKSPNFYYINSFINFVNDQLTRMEKSIFFQPAFLEQQMQSSFLGPNRKTKARELHREIVKQLKELAYKISIVEKYQESNEMQQLTRKAAQEEQANRFKDIQWDIYNNPFIVFNDCGTITPIFRNIEDVPKPIIDYQYGANRKDKDSQYFKKYEELTNDEYIEKILEICVIESQKERIRKQKDLKNIVFTLDNFMKLVLIYLRIRAFEPIILMGETGVGKTSLVEYLSKVIDADFQVLNVHAGITEQEIIDFVENAQVQARIQGLQPGDEEKNKRKLILFFDEINTNSNISGLLKEIFIDRHINGCALEKNICLVSACNPYKLRNKELSGATSGIKMYDKNLGSRPEIGDATMSKLVYRVLPLPESMVAYIWDYKSLDQQEERKYIHKMIEKTYESAKIIGQGISLVNLWCYKLESEKQKVAMFNQEIDKISMVVQKSQTYIKKEEDSPWAVSLRDVSRFCKLFVYFCQNNLTCDKAQQQSQLQTSPSTMSLQDKDLQQFTYRDVALVLAIYFCYVIRISVHKERMKYLNFVAQQTASQRMENLITTNFLRIVKREQDRFLDQMELKSGIGKNAPLKENIFVIITCILNQIPLIITGKPGSSKTLAMNLINKSFKGNISNKEFFKRFPAFLSFYYQGSEQSTSKGIERIYKKAHKTQKKVREKNTQVVVIFDEIGLAEKSPHNPLKVLHSLLEPPKVATVGISNWSLDASKMNRVITLSRTDPDNSDLLESARSIAKDSNPIFELKYLKSLVDWYIYYIKRQENNPKCKNFHGLRDFYSMIKFISTRITDDEGLNELVILHGIQRNFGGSNFDMVIQTLEMHLQLKNWDALKKIKPDNLIKDNLVDYESRHLMIITDNFENTLQFIQDECQAKQRQFEIFYGSDFPDDQNEESIYKQINEIILQMENGTLCIFLNLNNIYQSFYDMLNQNYQEIGNQRFCKVAIGPDSSRCLVHENFKCILIVDESKIEELDPPLLNRFEKQLFTEEISIDQDQKSVINKLNSWLNSLQVSNFQKRQMFPTIDEQQSLQQLVIQNKDLYGGKSEQIELECKRSLIRVSTFQGIIRCVDSNARDRKDWYDEYIDKQHHFNLYQLLRHYLDTWKDEACFQKIQGFNLIVYTFSAMIKMIEGDKKIQEIKQQEQLINLSSIHKKKQFQQKIEDFFAKNNQNRLLLIYADMLSDSKNRINLCRSIINNQRTKRSLNKLEGEELLEKHICFIIRIDQHKDDQNISYGKDWRQYTIDLLNGKGQTDISVKKLIKNDFETLIRLASAQTTLFETSIVESMSKIYYNKNQEFISQRITQIQELFQSEENIEYLRNLILLKVKQNENFESINNTWRLQVVKNEFLMKSNLTFHGAALEYIKSELVKYLAFIVFYLEQDGIINARHSTDLFVLAKDYFRNLFKSNYINNRIQDMYFLAQNFDRIKFPLARLIHLQFMQLKIQYVKILKEQATQNTIQDLDEEDQEAVFQAQKVIQEEEQKLASLNKKSIKIEKEKLEMFKKILVKDNQLRHNISNLEQWCKIYFPQDYIDQKILTIENQIYADDFSYLLDNQDIITTNTLHHDYNKFIKISLSLLLKEKFDSKAQIYGVLWKCESLLSTVWKIIKDNIKLFAFNEMINKLEAEIKAHDYYQRSELHYLPREAYVESLIKVFYQLYYPSDHLKTRFNLWEQNVKQTFQKLNDLAYYYLHVRTTDESRVIIFLLKFNQEIISKRQPLDKETIFINLAQNIKNTFHQPQDIIDHIFILRDKLIKDQSAQVKESLSKKIFKFVCEYIIDADDKGDEIETQFLFDKILTVMINTTGKKEESLQYDEKFKFLMLKLIYIALYSLEAEACIGAMETLSTEAYQQYIQENEVMGILEDFLNENGFLRFNDPFIIALVDQIEENLDEEVCMDEQLLESRMLQAQKIILNNNLPLLQQIIAIAFFKKIANIYCQELSFYLSSNDQAFEAIALQVVIEKFFDIPNAQLLLPFAIYILKVLYQSHDVLKSDLPKVLEKNKWIKSKLNLDISVAQNMKTFSYINHEEYKQWRNDASQKMENIEELLKLKELSPFRKFCVLLTIIEQTALQGKSLDTSALQKLFPEDFIPNVIVEDEYTKDFLLPFCTNQFEQYQKRNKFIKIEPQDKEKQLYQFKVIQMFLGAAALSSNSFLYEFFANPKNIKDYFVPFVQNTKEDYDYQQKLQNNEYVASLQCQQCKQITLAIELVPKIMDASKLYIQGDKQCQFCKNQDEKHRLQEFHKGMKKEVSKFSTDEMALKSYISFESESYQSIRVRNLSELELALGRIILHSLLMLSLSFTKQETEIFSMILSDYPYSGNEYKNYLIRTIKYLTTCFSNDWVQLKCILNVNNEKILQIIEYLIIDIVKNIHLFKVEQLNTIKGRLEFEKAFSIICRKLFQQQVNDPVSSVRALLNQIGFEQEIERLLLEFNDVDSSDVYHLLRIQSKISIKQFEQYLTQASGDRTDHNFFKLLFEQKESIQSIQYLKPLTQWARYIFNKWNAQLTYDEANELTIRDIIERENTQNKGNKDYISKIEKDFAKFQQAWNKFAGLIIRDQNVEVTIPPIAVSEKLIFCCITSDKYEQKGHIFYLLLKYLALKQNQVLEEAAKMVKQKQNNQINSISFPSTSLLNIRKDQIIYFREKPVKTIKRKYTMMDELKQSELHKGDSMMSKPNQANKEKEKEKFENIIIENSSCNLKYGQGTQVEYNIEQIKNSSIELLLKGKYLVDMEHQKFNFQFVNIGNLYSQFEDIKKKIKQEYSDLTYSILEKKRDEEIHQLLGQLRTTMNFIQNSEMKEGDDNFANKSILEFMRALKILDNDQHLENDLKLKHIICLYEAVEERVEHIEVEKINPRYQVPLSSKEYQFQVLGQLINEKRDYIEKLMHIVGRLCIRQLRNFQKDISSQNLFSFLAREQNQQLFFKLFETNPLASAAASKDQLNSWVDISGPGSGVQESSDQMMMMQTPAAAQQKIILSQQQDISIVTTGSGNVIARNSDYLPRSQASVQTTNQTGMGDPQSVTPTPNGTPFNDESRVEDTRLLLQDFIRANVEIKHAKDVYFMFRQQFEIQENEKRMAQENEKQRQQDQQNQRQVDEVDMSNIVMSEIMMSSSSSAQSMVSASVSAQRRAKPAKGKKAKKGKKGNNVVEEEDEGTPHF